MDAYGRVLSGRRASREYRRSIIFVFNVSLISYLLSEFLLNCHTVWANHSSATTLDHPRKDGLDQNSECIYNTRIISDMHRRQAALPFATVTENYFLAVR